MRWWMTLTAAMILMAGTFAKANDRPNFIIIFTDDQGYGDLGCYGSPNIRTPNIDRMADEGIRFTSFYAAPFCGPSRASLMTGCYAPRVSLAFNHGPKARTGLHPDETTIAELLRDQGYATMHVGKWHLGDHPQFLPTRHGFDKFYGLPYSNDMWPYHPMMPATEDPRMIAARERADYTGYAGKGRTLPADHPFSTPLPLMRNEEIIETNPDQTKLTTSYTEQALAFITDNKDQPFFLYLAHAMPHVPLFVSSKFEGQSRRGLYGDVIMEIDWSVGRILDHLATLGIDDRTLVVYTSDNGPWLAYGIDGGSAGPLRDGKGSVWEGGVRVPAIVRWPGRIPGGFRTSEIAGNIDLLPTFARLAGATVPEDRVIDGRDLWPLLSGKSEAEGPHDAFYYYHGSSADRPANLGAVRDDRWKLHVKFEGSELHGTALYDLQRDVSEKFDRIKDHPDIARRLETMAREFNKKLLASRRPLGRL